MRASRSVLAFALAAIALAPRVALADDALAEAKELFRRGVELFEVGDLETALDLFRRSRARFASMQNTLDMAICLEALGRDDEALEAYDEAIAAFGKELSEAERANIARKVRALRAKVGSIDVASNVNGAVVVDGRDRARLPLAAPIRVTAGAHVVRVIKDGFATFEATVDVGAGERVPIDAKLAPLTSMGGLRVEDVAVAGSDVVVDGVVVGVAPWEGTLAPGTHVVWTRKGAAGSAPTRAVVLQGQTALLRVSSGPLGAVATVTVRPSTASIAIGGLVVGHGRWEAALPAGHYDVDVAEDGFFARRASFDVAPGAAPFRADMTLTMDTEHARWGVANPGHFVLGVFAGGGLSPSLGSGAEASCTAYCTRHGYPGGVMLGARGGYELHSRISIEAAGGYLYVGSSLARQVFAGRTTLALDDEARVSGFWLSAGLSYRVPVIGGWELRPRAHVGFIVAHASDPVTGTATLAGETAPRSIVVAGGTDVAHSTPFFALTEVGLERAWGKFRLGASVSTFFLPSPGPASTHGQVAIATANGSVTTSALAGERAYGSFVVLMPQLSIGYVP
jgi:hypothetical protein